ncbi:MAG TPA: dephospho-CoA kinase [Geminicoccus sp.]|jgi:dephospho-CoA kinase|uniref:dephospho-CoA kinase n=1 Tax=Geminicoccus sp. TaxID=2024832 RepID=UPI002E2F53F6|nr:dephospho-CoA kinase [Geminicoccus sp.]HEX2529475.1 dephospho-CoA kinase [Geminicoccus sp.]
MLLIGLTGSIATGKSHVAALFRAMGVPVFDADQAVHALFRPGGAAVAAVAAAFDGVQAADGSIDRAALGRAVFGDTTKLRRLEAIVHPPVRASERAFLEAAARLRFPVVVLDIPLLFETAGERRVDKVVAVGCSDALQEQRALRRPGMTPERLSRIRAQQVPTAVKRRRADLFIPSGFDRGAVQRRLVAFLDELALAKPLVWPHSYGNAARLSERT